MIIGNLVRSVKCGVLGALVTVEMTDPKRGNRKRFKSSRG